MKTPSLFQNKYRQITTQIIYYRFLQEYQKNNITFWGITTQNEPTDGCIQDFPFQSMCFPPENQRDFLKLHLGPTLQKANFGVDNLKLMILDDDRLLLPKWAEVVGCNYCLHSFNRIFLLNIYCSLHRIVSQAPINECQNIIR